MESQSPVNEQLRLEEVEEEEVEGGYKKVYDIDRWSDDDDHDYYGGSTSFGSTFLEEEKMW